MDAELQQLDWVRVMRRELDENDRRIREGSLDDGWSVVKHRGRAIREAMQAFFQQAMGESPPRGAVAIHATGGTGRGEVCPGSDVDVGIIVENIEENEVFLSHVAEQLRQVSPLVPGLREVVKANAFPDLKEEEYFDLPSLASLLDADLLVGDSAFDNRIRQVGRERAAREGLRFVFHINRELQRLERTHPQPPGDVGGFHVKNGIGGLRNFQMTMWLYAFERWLPSVEVYEQVRSSRRFDSEGAPTAEVLDAAGVIFFARCWIEQRRRGQEMDDVQRRRTQLLIEAADMDAFRGRFGAEGLTQLNEAREAISSYRNETLDRLLERGVVVPESDGLVVWGAEGLRIESDALFRDASEMFFSIYRAKQRFTLPIAKSVRRAARKNIAQSLRPDPAFMRQMTMPRSVFPTLKDWHDFGVLYKLVPGFHQLSQQLYEPGHRAASLTLAARAMQRVQNLEQLDSVSPASATPAEAFFARQYRDLGESGRGALRLALLTDEIPQTLYRREQTYSAAVRRYGREHLSHIPGLSPATRRVIEFLVIMKRMLLQASETSDHEAVLEDWRRRIALLKSPNPADTIRAMSLFAYAAFDFRNPPDVPRPRLEFEQWQNVQNLIQNLLCAELGVDALPFQQHFFDETGRRIANSLPRRLLASPHVNAVRGEYEGPDSLDPFRAHPIIQSFKEVHQTGRPQVMIVREPDYWRLTLYARDFHGLFWRVAGALFEQGCSVRSTALYAIPQPDAGEADAAAEAAAKAQRAAGAGSSRQLIYDVLTFDSPADAAESWQDHLRSSVLHRLQHPGEEIEDNTKSILDPVRETLSPELTDRGDGQAKFSCHSPASNKGMRYAVSRLLSECAGAEIDSIVRDGTRDWPIPRTNFYVRIPATVREAADSLGAALGDIRVNAAPP